METWLIEHADWLFLIVIVGCFLFLLVRQQRINNAPAYTGTATVQSRRMGTARYHGKYSSGYNYLVTFALGETNTVELYVSEMEYIQLKEGLRGQLVWQNENMLSFEYDS